jgi:enoyl-CoA hydratase
MGTVTVERLNNIAIVTLRRPERHNAFNDEMWRGFELAIEELAGKLPRVVVITGEGEKAFCAGFDVNPDNPQITSFLDAIQNHNRESITGLIHYIRGVTDRFAGLPVPLIAAVNGMAFGGGAELAARCDIRVVDPSAVFCFSEVRLGLMPDWGGGVALTRLLGPARAADLILTARRLGADEAYRMGLAERVSASGASLDDAISMAVTISQNGPHATRAALSVIRKTPDLRFAEALDMESELAAGLIAGGECVHGITALLSKKEPDFPDPD